MNKQIFGRKLGRNTNTRKALYRSLVRALVLHGSIKTTKAKAKAIQGEVDSLLTKAGSGSLETRRAVLGSLGNDKQTTSKLFGELAAMTKSRKSGFTRIINLPTRKGDRAKVVKLEWVDPPVVKEKRVKKEKVSKKALKKDSKKKLKVKNKSKSKK